MSNSNTIAIEIVVDDKGSATVKQFAANTEQGLKKTESSAAAASGALGGFRESWIGLSAAALAAWAVINKALSWAEIGAKADQTRQTFQSVSSSYGVHADDIVSAAKRATDGTVGSSLIMQKAMKAMTQDIDPNRLPDLFEAARVSARIAGVSVGEAADTIIDATANNMPRALRQFGLVSKEEMGVFNKAIAAGVEDVKLLDFVMATAKIRMAELGGIAKNDAERFQEFQTVISGLTKTVGGVVLDFVRGVYGGFASVSAGAMMLVGGLTDVGAGLTWLSAKAAEFMGNKDNATAMRKEYESLHKTATDWYGAAGTLWDQTLDLFDKNTKASKKYTAAELENLRSQKNGMLENLQAQTEAAKNNEKNKATAEAAAKKLEAAENELTNEIQKTLADRKKYEGSFYNWKAAEAEAWLQKYKDAGVSEEKIAVLRKEKLINVNTEIYAEYRKTLKSWEEDTKKKQAAMIEEEEKADEATKKTGLDRLVAYQLLYKDLQGFEGQYYEVSKRLIEEKAVAEAAILTKGLIDFEEIEKAKLDVAQATMLKLKQLDIEKKKSSDNFMDGMKAGIDEIQLKQVKWGQVGFDTFKGMSVGMATTFSTVFEDAYKRDLKSIGDYSTMIWDTTRLAFFKAAGDMAQQSLIINISAGWTDAGKSTLGIVDKLLSYAGVTSSLYASAEALNLGQYVGVNFSQGGPIPGNARYPGDHPGNDTVPIWASPGEVMIRRSSVNSETSAILDYINKFGSVPAYYGGGVINTITNEPGRGYWGFSSFFESVQDIWSSVNPMGKNVLGSPTAQQIVDSAITQAITKAVVIAGIAYMAGAVGAGLYGAAGAGAAGAGGAGSTAGTGSALTYGSPEFVAAAGKIGLSEAAALSLTDASLGGISATQLSTMTAAEIGMTLAQKIGSNILSHIMKGPGGDMGANKAGDMGGSFNLGIAGGYGSGVSKTLSDLFGAMPKSQIISADTGIDYIPRDGVLVSTHKKEAVLNADAADQWRSGRGSGDVGELLAELKKLNASIDKGIFYIVKNTDRAARILNQWNGDGLPEERVLQRT